MQFVGHARKHLVVIDKPCMARDSALCRFFEQGRGKVELSILRLDDLGKLGAWPANSSVALLNPHEDRVEAVGSEPVAKRGHRITTRTGFAGACPNTLDHIAKRLAQFSRQNRCMRSIAILTFAFLTIVSAPAQTTYKSISESMKHWNVNLRYPVFQGKSPLAALANKAAKEKVLAMLGEFHQTTKEIGNGWTPVGKLTLEVAPVLASVRPDFISFHLEWNEYSGGAHPNHGTIPFAFGLVDGKPKQLKLADLIAPGTTSETFFMKRVKPFLDQQKQKRGGDKVYDIDPRSYDRFVVTSKGLAFFFDPYEMGPYAEGSYEVSLMFDSIRSSLNSNGPLRKFLKS